MFATKRSLSDAMNVVAKKLDDVYSSLAVCHLLCTPVVAKKYCNCFFSYVYVPVYPIDHY